MKIKYGIIAYELTPDPDEINIVHFCAYESPPSDDEFLGLMEELNTDPEFGLVGRMGVDVFLKLAPQDMVDEIAATFDKI